MRILVANANTSEEVTATIVAEAERFAGAGTTIRGANGRFGARVVGTRTETVIAAHALVDLLAEEAADVDAVLVGMSFDAGLWAARELLDIPVLGMTEAALLTACTVAPRFGLAVIGGRNAQTTRELVASYGLTGRMAGLTVLDATPQDLLADREAFLRPLVEDVARLAEEDGAEAVVLVGAVMADIPRLVQERCTVPLIEGISAGIVMLEGLIRLGLPKAGTGSLAPFAGRPSIGLRPPLAERLAGVSRSGQTEGPA
ncbi:aspartate/glutamate racemase family protein [Marinivivus vitaminiproducens]|uniref:aspartate/glutamate racemase family protein n=1 Tax=Marinivivus vitaminiproducens TaxID=3035935 RepID=UPI00279CC971|nr:aspartate/glutamate racemase family protein [Geminicoccaceae bacterium SCSIO 64248]